METRVLEMQSCQDVRADSVKVIRSRLENLGSEDKLAPGPTFISSSA